MFNSQTLTPSRKSSIGVLSPRFSGPDGIGGCRDDQRLRSSSTASCHRGTNWPGLNSSAERPAELTNAIHEALPPILQPGNRRAYGRITVTSKRLRTEPYALSILALTTRAMLRTDFCAAEVRKAAVYMLRRVGACGERGPSSEVTPAPAAA